MPEADKPLGALVRKTDIPMSVGLPTPEENRKWLGQQVVYANHVGKHDELDQKIATFVTNHRQMFYSRMGPVMRRWQTIWDAANGNPTWGEYEDDIHVPETQKKLEAKVARIEEALFEFDPIFEADGVRGDLPPWKAQVITSYVYRMMELAGFKKYVQPCARDQEICNVSALKLSWHTSYGKVVDRSWEIRERSNGQPYYHDERRMRDAVTWQGVRYQLVDPFLFFFDIDCGDLDDDDCAFVGDESDQFLHDIEAMAAKGRFNKEKVKLVRDRKAGQTSDPRGPVTATDWPDQYRLSRSIAQGQQFTQDARGDHDPRRVRCIEMWSWFDFGDGWDGVVDPLGKKITGTHKVVITMANGVPIQFRLNPFDKKFHPYAIGRIVRNGHEAVAPSKFEQVIQVNAQYDRYQSNVLRHSDLTVAPLVRTAGEFPVDNILGVRPGQVFSNVTDWQEMRVGDVPQSVSYFHQYFRRELEENSGALNVFESPQGTATETERKVQEQQRMVRNSIRANAEMWRQVALKTYWISGQFSTQPQRFAVAGKAAQVLGKSFEITPDLMQEEIDVRFLGLDSLHVFGNRLSGMAQWMNRWGPMLPSMPEVNTMALCRMDFELSVGRHGLMDVFPSSEPAWSLWPQEEENEMLMAGRSVPVSEKDHHEDHLRKMQPLMRNLSTFPKYVQSTILEHYSRHMSGMQRQREREAAELEKAQRTQLLTGGMPGQDKPPAEGGMPAQSKAQQQGVTPGPTQSRTVAKTGREGQGISQSQAMTA